MLGAQWLGLEGVAEDQWRLPVTSGVISGARALFGGCATMSAVVAAQELTDHPVVFATSHFGALAPLGSAVDLRGRVVSSGRTMAHLEIEGSFEGKHSFLTRVSAGSRPSRGTEGQWVDPQPVQGPEESPPFEHPVHQETWAGRFEWRLGGAEGGPAPVSSWWVRPAEGDPLDPLCAAPLLVDYVTYGVGRALGVPMGGLSIDNAFRVHKPVEAGWYLLQVRPEAIEGGFGFGSARLYAGDVLVASGSQSIVVNEWDWRLPGEG